MMYRSADNRIFPSSFLPPRHGLRNNIQRVKSRLASCPMKSLHRLQDIGATAVINPKISVKVNPLASFLAKMPPDSFQIHRIDLLPEN